MYLYIDSDSLYHIGDSIYPSGRYILETFNSDTVIQIKTSFFAKAIFGPIEITQIQREDDSYYTDLASILTDVGDFFK